MEQSDFNKLKAEIRTYLQDVVTPLINTDYNLYASTASPILYELRQAIFTGNREKTMNEFIQLRKAIENVTVQKN